MEAKNFRIGNLVQSKQWKGIGAIEGIEKTNDGFELKVKGYVHEWQEGKYFDLEPISINEDWLRNFNFKYYMKNVSGHPEKEHMVRRWQYKFFINGNEWWFDFEVDQQKPTNFFWLNWNFGGSNHFVHLPRKMEYVHELQNLFFALTGQELELKTESSTCG